MIKTAKLLKLRKRNRLNRKTFIAGKSKETAIWAKSTKSSIDLWCKISKKFILQSNNNIDSPGRNRNWNWDRIRRSRWFKRAGQHHYRADCTILLQKFKRMKLFPIMVKDWIQHKLLINTKIKIMQEVPLCQFRLL